MTRTIDTYWECGLTWYGFGWTRLVHNDIARWYCLALGPLYVLIRVGR